MQSKLFLVFLGIIILVFFFSMFSFVGKMEKTSKNRKIVEDKITELEKSKETFSSEIAKLKTEKGIEESIREKFGVAKEGENIIIIVDDKNSSVTTIEADSSWFSSFFNNLFK
jgi:cell division protein FtsB